jgi:hypothetical protein
MNRFRATLLVAVGGMSIGCGGSGPDPAAVNASIVVIERHDGDPVRFTGGAGRVMISETLTVEVKDGRLRINEKDHGPCNPGDKVRLEAGNVVKVNGEVRQPGR